MFKKNELKFLWPFYLERFFSQFFFFAPAFWNIQLIQSFSLFQIGILWASFSIASFLLEVPTGSVADIYGRKISTLIGYFICSIALFSLFFVKDFKLTLFLFILWALGGTFISGARESWIVDKLKQNKKDNLIREYYIKDHSLIGFSLALSGLLGAILVKRFDLDIIWFFGGLSFLISGIVLSFIKEYKFKKIKGIKNTFVQAKEGIKYSLKHSILLFLISCSFFIMLKQSIGGDVLWQPFLKSLGLSDYAFGYLFSFIGILGGVIPLFSNFILKRFSKEKNYLASLILISIILTTSVFFINNVYFGILIFILLFCIFHLYSPVNNNYLQKFIPSESRATIISFQSMVVSVSFALGFFLSGLIGDLIGTKYTIALAAIFLIPVFVLYIRIKEDDEE